MSTPPDNLSAQRNGHDSELTRFRPYLLMLARIQRDDSLQHKFDESDIVQQTLLEAHHSLATFRGRTDAEMAAWLRQILARNLADEVRKFRSGKRNARLEDSLQQSLEQSSIRIERWLAVDDHSPSERAIINEQILTLAAALLKLPADQRHAIELHHLQGHSSALVAKRMERSEIAVAGLLRRGLKNLRELIREDSSR